MFDKPKRYQNYLLTLIVFFLPKRRKSHSQLLLKYSKSNNNHMQIIFQYFLKQKHYCISSEKHLLKTYVTSGMRSCHFLLMLLTSSPPALLSQSTRHQRRNTNVARIGNMSVKARRRQLHNCYQMSRGSRDKRLEAPIVREYYLALCINQLMFFSGGGDGVHIYCSLKKYVHINQLLHNIGNTKMTCPLFLHKFSLVHFNPVFYGSTQASPVRSSKWRTVT